MQWDLASLTPRMKLSSAADPSKVLSFFPGASMVDKDCVQLAPHQPVRQPCPYLPSPVVRIIFFPAHGILDGVHVSEPLNLGEVPHLHQQDEVIFSTRPLSHAFYRILSTTHPITSHTLFVRVGPPSLTSCQVTLPCPIQPLVSSQAEVDVQVLSTDRHRIEQGVLLGTAGPLALWVRDQVGNACALHAVAKDRDCVSQHKASNPWLVTDPIYVGDDPVCVDLRPRVCERCNFSLVENPCFELDGSTLRQTRPLSHWTVLCISANSYALWLPVFRVNGPRWSKIPHADVQESGYSPALSISQFVSGWDSQTRVQAKGCRITPEGQIFVETPSLFSKPDLYAHMYCALTLSHPAEPRKQHTTLVLTRVSAPVIVLPDEISVLDLPLPICNDSRSLQSIQVRIENGSASARFELVDVCAPTVTVHVTDHVGQTVEKEVHVIDFECRRVQYSEEPLQLMESGHRFPRDVTRDTYCIVHDPLSMWTLQNDCLKMKTHVDPAVKFDGRDGGPIVLRRKGENTHILVLERVTLAPSRPCPVQAYVQEIPMANPFGKDTRVMTLGIIRLPPVHESHHQPTLRDRLPLHQHDLCIQLHGCSLDDISVMTPWGKRTRNGIILPREMFQNWAGDNLHVTLVHGPHVSAITRLELQCGTHRYTLFLGKHTP